MADTPARQAALDARDELWADPRFQADYHSPYVNVRRRAIDELNQLTHIITGETGQAAGTGRAAPRPSAASPAETRRAAPVQPPATKAPYSPAVLRDALKGLSGGQRAAKLTEMFGDGIVHTTPGAGAASPADIGVGAGPGAA